MRKNSRVPCVASPSATTRALPAIAPTSARSSKPDPGASVRNGRALAENQATVAASATLAAELFSKSRFDGTLGFRRLLLVILALSAPFGFRALDPVVGTLVSTISKRISSTRTMPRPCKSVPIVMPTASIGTSSTTE